MSTEKQKRGCLTTELNEMAKNFFGREFGDFGCNRIKLSSNEFKRLQTDELRLISYIQYCLTNFGIIDQRKINNNDCHIIEQWETEGHCKEIRVKDRPGVWEVSVTKEFWNFMTEILWQCYVVYDRC